MTGTLWETVRQISEQATLAANATDTANQMIDDAVHHAVEQSADPHLVLGSLIDGIATVLRGSIAADAREGVTNELLVLLYRRVDAMDATGGAGLFDAV